MTKVVLAPAQETTAAAGVLAATALDATTLLATLEEVAGAAATGEAAFEAPTVPSTALVVKFENP